MAILTSPWRDTGSITGATCHTEPAKLLSDPSGVTLAGSPTRISARSCCDICARISISPPRARRNSPPAPGPTTWPTSIERDRISPLVGARMSSRPIRARLPAKIGLGDADARVGGIARGAPAVDIGLGHEAARDQRLGAVELILGERRVGPRHGDLRRQLARLPASAPSDRSTRAPGPGGPSFRHRHRPA